MEVNKISESIVMGCLTPFRETNIGEHHAGFLPGRFPKNRFFYLLRVIWKKPYMQRHLAVVIFLELKGTFDPVNRTTQFSALHWMSMPKKLVNPVREHLCSPKVIWWTIKFIRKDELCLASVPFLHSCLTSSWTRLEQIGNSCETWNISTTLYVCSNLQNMSNLH